MEFTAAKASKVRKGQVSESIQDAKQQAGVSWKTVTSGSRPRMGAHMDHC